LKGREGSKKKRIGNKVYPKSIHSKKKKRKDEGKAKKQPSSKNKLIGGYAST